MRAKLWAPARGKGQIRSSSVTILQIIQHIGLVRKLLCKDQCPSSSEGKRPKPAFINDNPVKSAIKRTEEEARKRGPSPEPQPGLKIEHAFNRSCSLNTPCPGMEMTLVQVATARAYLHQKQNYFEFLNNCYDPTPLVKKRLRNAGQARAEGLSPTEGCRLNYIFSKWEGIVCEGRIPEHKTLIENPNPRWEPCFPPYSNDFHRVSRLADSI